MRVFIVGGTGETGRWFARFFRDNGFEVVVWGVNRRLDIAEKMGVEFAVDPKVEAGRCDVVLVSVPIEKTEEAVREIAPCMKPGSLLMDVTSLKVGPLEAMERFAPPGVEVLGSHPMFGPTISGIGGQVVILVPTGRCEKWLGIIKGLFERNGAHIEMLTAEEHDRLMAVVQGLTHFAYISIGCTFRELGFDVQGSRRFVSPVYEIMLDFVGRILGQNPHLYAMIQMNPEVRSVHETFLSQCKHISSLVARGEVLGFVEEMKKAASHFGDTEAALRRSDKLINQKIREFQELVKSLGQERGFRHLYSGAVHVGVVERVTPRQVLLRKGKRRIWLKIENIELLTPGELAEWKTQNLRPHLRDVSVFIPSGADTNIIREIITMVEGVTSVETIDIYRRSGATSATYRLRIRGDLEANSVQSRVERLLEGVGCRLRG